MDTRKSNVMFLIAKPGQVGPCRDEASRQIRKRCWPSVQVAGTTTRDALVGSRAAWNVNLAYRRASKALSNLEIEAKEFDAKTFAGSGSVARRCDGCRLRD